MPGLLDLDETRRDAILNAALREFIMQGYEKASTNEIAKQAGMAKALMFHYVGSKQQLLLTTYDYFKDLMKTEYEDCMNYEEKDVFERLRQSYKLQLAILTRYPWISEFNRIHQESDTEEIIIEQGKRERCPDCYSKIFEDADWSKLRGSIEPEKAKQFILWINVGFINQTLDEIRNSNDRAINVEQILSRIDHHLNELRKVFYEC